MLQQNSVAVDLLIGDQATPEVFSKRLVAKPYDLLHFAGHGCFDDAEPRKSGLVLAEERVVYGEELERVLSGQPFVFLSSCDAGAGKTGVSQMGFWGKYTEGIAIWALLGGAMGCLGPMWVIGDGIAKDFALEFYRHLLDLDKVSIGEAVRQARVWAKEQGNPDFWAAWILYGDPLQKFPTST
jgi:CHAT domain-containing protein